MELIQSFTADFERDYQKLFFFPPFTMPGSNLVCYFIYPYFYLQIEKCACVYF